MLYLLVISIIVCAVVCWLDKEKLYLFNINEKDLFKRTQRHMYLSIILILFFTISAVVGTVIVCNSNFLSITTEESSNTYKVTDFSAERSAYNLVGDYETKYSITVDNLLIEVSSQDIGVEIICNNYKPTTVTVEESHYFKWWFLSPYDTCTYTLS